MVNSPAGMGTSRMPSELVMGSAAWAMAVATNEIETQGRDFMTKRISKPHHAARPLGRAGKCFAFKKATAGCGGAR
jgi:hypothetical protein